LKASSDQAGGARQEQSADIGDVLAAVAEATDEAVLVCDESWLIRYVNPGFTRLFGWNFEEVMGRHPADLLTSGVRDLQPFAEILARGETVRREDVLKGCDGQRCWASIVIEPLIDQGGVPLQFVVLIRDITTVKLHETLQQNVLEAMARDQPLVDVLDLVCREVEAIAPDIHSSILTLDDAGCLHPLVAPRMPDDYCRAIDGMPIGPIAGSCGTAAYFNKQIIVADIEHDPLWADFRDFILPHGYAACWSSPIRLPSGEVTGTFALYFRECMQPTPFHQQILNACSHLCGLAMEREQARLKIRKLAWYDSLTGLPNRGLLLSQAQQVAADLGDSPDVLGVLVLNLDRFKLINELQGHAAGDGILRDVARLVRLGFHPEDIVGRLSGDEFVAVLRRENAAAVTDSVERLQKRITAARTPTDGQFLPTVSIGIAMFPADGRDMELLIQRADIAMHQAKVSQPGSYRFFSSDMNALVQERLLLEGALRRAIRDCGELELHYQPQVAIGSCELTGAEALARWRHPRLGLISPARFIPLAEECGLIDEIGRWALREACSQLARWRLTGLAVPAVSVNLSASSLHDRNLPAFISEVLAANGLVAGDLTLEITESVLLDTHPTTFETIADVNRLGVRLSLDDFGTGYASLGNLLRLPIAEIKLDRSFVAGLEREDNARALSEAVIRIGDSLHLNVVAEGVETPAQRALLADLGYKVAQGYLFARPMSAQEFAGWLGGRRAEAQ
jgi:diguanylate cyclase (GGDEF)-like protein/PAS domain S-box-containing protein